MKYLIDTHFHLDHYKNYIEVANRICELQQYTVAVTNSPGVFRSCKNIFNENKYLHFAMGFHPQERLLCNDDLNDFIKLLDKTEFVGEIGLDYSRNNYMDKAYQKKCFEQIVECCAQMNKAMTIHIRNAEDDAVEILRKYEPKKAIIHWYTGDEKHLYQLLETNCYFSININMVTGKNSDKYRIIPMDNILIESDGPYTKVSGKKYTPDLLQNSYLMIAKFFEDRDLIQHVYDNFRGLLLKK